MKVLGILLHNTNQVTAALLDVATGSFQSDSFEVSKGFPEALESFVGQVAVGEDIIVGAELHRTPQDAFPEFMHFLRAISKFAAANIGLAEDKSKFLIGDIPDFMKWAAHGQKEVKLIFPGMARALFCFEKGREPTKHEYAASIAAICGSTGKYRYCRSEGVVPSGGDVAFFLQYPPDNGSGVVSAGDWYQMVPIQTTNIRAQRGDVYLTYELGKKEYEYLYGDNALKMGLLHCCREYFFELYCGALDGEEGEMLGRVMDIGVGALNAEYLVWGPSIDKTKPASPYPL